MLINEILKESILDEYSTFSSYDPSDVIEDGDLLKSAAKPVQTPITEFDVRYIKEHMHHDYYFYDKVHGNCIGLFSIEEKNLSFPYIVKPGVRIVSPHMALDRQFQRKGIAKLCYTTFLMGGPWVFVTDEHTKGASKLWDSLSTGNIVSLYYDDDSNQILKKPDIYSYRLLGPRDRFKLPKNY